MNTADAAHHPPQYWPTTGRPVMPYRVDYNPLDGSSISPRPTTYLLDPIHPWLLQLKPGDVESFQDFIASVGIAEFLDWAYTEAITVWSYITERFRGDPSPLMVEIAVAWTNPATVTDVTRQQTLLREAYSQAQEIDDPRTAATAVVATGWELDAFRIELDLDPDSGVIFERPRNLWSRAWFELLDGLRSERVPRVCEYCSNPFVPTKSNQRYCSGTECQQRAYDRRRSRTEDRRAYQREYQRQRRANDRTKEE